MRIEAAQFPMLFNAIDILAHDMSWSAAQHGGCVKAIEIPPMLHRCDWRMVERQEEIEVTLAELKTFETKLMEPTLGELEEFVIGEEEEMERIARVYSLEHCGKFLNYLFENSDTALLAK